MRRILKLPDTVAESLQQDSLAPNEEVLGDTETPSTSRGLTSHLEAEPETTKKMKGNDSQSEDAEDDLRVTPGQGDKLGEDELTLIFRYSWISTQDLLNFRLVNKRWRDAAATTLLQRDACVVGLSENLAFHPPCFLKKIGIGEFQNENKLSQLTELISMSSKFPSTDYRMNTSYMNFNPYTRFPDLLNFFRVHRDKIKTLRHNGKITAKCLLDILHNYAPALESLDLSKAEISESGKEDSGEGNALKWTSKPFLLKSLTLGRFGYYCKQQDTSNEDNSSGSDTHDSCPCKDRAFENELIRLILSSPSKLGSIENATLNTLQMILTEGKGHLIRSFKYHFGDAYFVPASQLTKFISLSPKPQLSKVTLDLQGHFPSCAQINPVNEFIESFKDTVQSLKVCCRYDEDTWDRLLNIPPMRNLKSVTLKLGNRCEDHFAPDCRVCQAEESQIFVGIRGTFFWFQDGISAQNYFPRLMEVHLHSNLSKFDQVSPMSFFSFKSDTDTADGLAAKSGFFPKVDILKINQIDVGSIYRPAGTFHSPAETLLVADVFPNIRILKLMCGEVSNLSSALWTLCPNVEFMEISGIASCSSRGSRRREVENEMSRFVDKVFTGCSDRILRYLQRSAAGNRSEADDSEDFKCEPRISDLRRLRELKLKFVGKWSTEFASSVTGVQAFSKMENTKFIIFYDPYECFFGFPEKVVARRDKIDKNADAANGSVENRNYKLRKHEEFIFGPLKPYILIVHEKPKYKI